MNASKLTRAQKDALKVLNAVHPKPVPTSYFTSKADVPYPCVSGVTIAALERLRLVWARPEFPHPKVATLTDYGREVAGNL